MGLARDGMSRRVSMGRDTFQHGQTSLSSDVLPPNSGVRSARGASDPVSSPRPAGGVRVVRQEAAVESRIRALRRTDSERNQFATSRSCWRMTRCCSDRRKLGFGREIAGGAACARAPSWACGVCCMCSPPRTGGSARRDACRRKGGRLRRRSTWPSEPVSGWLAACAAPYKAWACAPRPSADPICVRQPQSTDPQAGRKTGATAAPIHGKRAEQRASGQAEPIRTVCV